MASQFFNRIGQVGLGVALVGGVVNSALFNGDYRQFMLLITKISLFFWKNE